MSVAYAPDVTDRFATAFIRRTAKALVGDGAFPESDLGDLIQELHLALIAQAPNFDCEKARWSTFVKHVVRTSAISLRRHRNAQCRRGECETISLNILIADSDGALVELGATVSEEEHRSGLGQDSVDHADFIALALDVDDAKSSLPADLLKICQRLKARTPTEVRRELGISKSTMDRRLATLREHLRGAGLSKAA